MSTTPWSGTYADIQRLRPAKPARVERFIVEQYTAGRSLRELAELTDRSFSAVRNILDKHGVRRRAVGAARLLDEPGTTAAGRIDGSVRRGCIVWWSVRGLSSSSRRGGGGLCSPSATTE